MPLILALAFQLAASSPYSAAERDQWDRVAKTVTIHRDKYGVPPIYGPTDASVAFGLMYAEAEDNSWQLDEDYLGDLGRRAEVYGDSVVAGRRSSRDEADGVDEAGGGWERGRVGELPPGRAKVDA
jgi:acyl-homoserine lactone acylase PvdQ